MSAASVKRTTRLSAERRREAIAGYLFLLPNFLGFLIFVLGPVVAAFGLGFVKWDMASPPQFIGLQNYRRLLFHDQDFWRYVYNTVFLMLGIPVGMAASLLLAIVLNQKIRGRVIFRTVYFLPTMCSGVAIFFLWRWILDAEFGLANQLLTRIGLPAVGWLTTTAWAKPSLILMGLWTSVGGFNMILYLAALQNVPTHLYEAAEIDGAGRWHKFRHVTWPYLTPTTFFISIMSIIGGLQGGFEAAYIMTAGGPAGSTTTISFYLFKNIRDYKEFGYAASIAWLLFFMVLIFTLLNWRFGGRLVQYD